MRTFGAVLLAVAISAAWNAATLSAQPWRQLYPGSPTSDLYAVLQWNGDTVFAAGANGTFNRSSDGGFTWRPVFSTPDGWNYIQMGRDDEAVYLLPTYSYWTYDETLLDSARFFLLRYDVRNGAATRVYFPDTVNRDKLCDLSVARGCIAVLQYRPGGFQRGGPGELWQSTNQGASWDRLPLPDSLSDTRHGSIYFRNRDTAILIGYSKSSDGYIPFITRDRGASWRAIPSVVYPSDPYSHDVPKRPCSFAGDSLIVLVDQGIDIRVSSDGGDSWQQRAHLNAVISSVHLAASGIGYAVGMQGDVCKTADAWATAIRIRDPLQDQSNRPTGCMLRDDKLVVCGLAGWIMATGDGGATWDDALSEILFSKGLVFFSRTEGACAGTDLRTGTLRCYRTDDGGITWTQRPALPAIGTVHHADANVAFCEVEKPLCIYRSTDKGATWSAWFTSQLSDSLQGGIVLRGSRDTCFLSTRNSIMVTTDGGTSWLQKQWPAGTSTLKSLYAVRGTTCWVKDASSGVFISQDNGDSWKQVLRIPDTGSYAPRYFAFQAIGDAEAVCSVWDTDGELYIYHTTDGGAAWERHLSVNQLLASFTALPHGVAYAVVGNISDLVVKTNDLWQTQEVTHARNDLDGITSGELFFLDERNGWYATRNSIMRTTNGGVDWIAASPAPSAPRLAQNYPNPTVGSTVIPYTVPAAGGGTIRIELFDASGRCVRLLHEGEDAPGEHRLSFDTAGLAAGWYALMLISSEHREIRSLIIAH